MISMWKVETWLGKNDILKYGTGTSGWDPDETDNLEPPTCFGPLLPVEEACNPVSGRLAFLWLKTL